MLVAVSSLGLYAIAAGFLAMIMYLVSPFLSPFSFGFIEYPFKFEVSDLWPRSISAFLQNFGIIVYCMGFILFLLTQYVPRFPVSPSRNTSVATARKPWSAQPVSPFP